MNWIFQYESMSMQLVQYWMPDIYLTLLEWAMLDLQ